MEITSDTITLRAMRFHVRVGILAHERELPQPLEVDLVVDLQRGAGVVDYRGLYEDAAGVARDEPHDYLESIAERIAERALARGGVARARVAVRKPHVGLGGPLAYAEVAVDRARRD